MRVNPNNHRPDCSHLGHRRPVDLAARHMICIDGQVAEPHVANTVGLGVSNAATGRPGLQL